MFSDANKKLAQAMSSLNGDADDGAGGPDGDRGGGGGGALRRAPSRRMTVQVNLFNKRRPDRVWQQLLRNLGLDSLLVRAVEIPYSTFRAGFAEKGTPAGDQKDETYEVLFEVVRAAWQCVRSFVLCNAENQAIFAEHMPFLIAEMKACPELGIAEVLIEVFPGVSGMKLRPSLSLRC